MEKILKANAEDMEKETQIVYSIWVSFCYERCFYWTLT